MDLSPILAFLTINGFNNAAEALPCDLATHQAKMAAAAAKGSSNSSKKKGRKRSHVGGSQERKSLEMSWETFAGHFQRMNPVLLVESFKQRQAQEKLGIAA